MVVQILRGIKNYNITAKGTKVTSSISSECEFTITGIQRETQNKILKKCSPGTIGSSNGVTVYLDVGRESYGAAQYFKGDVYRAYPIGKPDMGIRLKCLTGYANKRTTVQRGGLAEFTSLKQIATWVAADCGYSLSFEITDKKIRSYSFTGSAHESLIHLEKLADAEVYVDNDTLYVKEQATKASGKVIYSVNNTDANLLSAQATETGVVVKMLFNPNVTIGSVIDLTSELNPAIDGQYSIYKLNFDVSKRGTEFYLTVEGMKYA